MTSVELSGAHFDVTSASDVDEDTETLEFRGPSEESSELAAAVTQVGDYGSPDVSIVLFRELPLAVVEQMIEYSRRRLGIVDGAGEGPGDAG